MILAIAILLLFLLFAGLMYLNKLPALLALPLMAVVIALIAGIPLPEIITKVVAEGAVKLNLAIITVLIGAMLSQFVSRSGIAETLIKKAAELSGDRPLAVALVLTLVEALLFTVLGGLGAVIMVATIILPILLSIGIPKMVAGCLFLLGLSLGGILNLGNWQLYISVLGLSQNQILNFALPFALAGLIVMLSFLFIELKRSKLSPYEDPPFESVSWYALLTPLIPLILVLGFILYKFEFPIISAMLIGLLYGFLTTFKKLDESINNLSRSIIEGVASVAPAVAIMMGIGMVLNAVTHPQVSNLITPLVKSILPSTPWYYVLFFAILAPLSLYRGPLNIWGMGAGLIGLMLASKSLPVAAIMAALLSVGQIQGVCDPTNTHNVWIANFLNINVQEILRRTILYMWILAIFGLIIAGIRYF